MTSKADILAQLKSAIRTIEEGNAAQDFEGLHHGDRDFESESRSPSLKEEGENHGVTDYVISFDVPQDEAHKAYQKILRWVSVRERSTAYIRERLAKDEFSPQAIESALQKACRCQAVDDRRYCDALIRSTLAAGKGLRLIRKEIESLGIEPTSLHEWREHEAKGRDFELERALSVLRLHPPHSKRPRDAAYRKLYTRGYSSDIAASAAREWSSHPE